MGINATTGLWEEEDQSVEKPLTGLLKTDSPLMQAAAGNATQTMNARGLVNTSINTQAGQAAVIGAALPIATQDASQTFQRNQAGQGLTQSKVLQAQQGDINKGIVGMQTESAERIAAQQAQTQAAATQAQKDIAAAAQTGETTRTGMTVDANAKNLLLQIGSNEKLQAGQLAVQKEMQGLQLTSQEKLAAADLKAAQSRVDAQNATQVQIAGMNISANDKVNLGNAINAANVNYTSTVQAIMGNPNIPVEARNTYFASAAAIRNDALKLTSTTYGVTLTWSTPDINAPASTYVAVNPGTGQ